MFRRRIGGIAAAVALAVAIGSRAGEADRAPKRRNKQSKPEVAVLNLSRLYKEYEPFKRQMKELEALMKRAETEADAEKAEIASLKGRLDGLQPGDPNRAQLEREVAQRIGALTVDVKTLREQFLRRQGRIHNETYDAVLEEVAAYSREHGIRLVLRFADEPVNPDKPEDVLKRINKGVIWCDGQVDITDAILKRLKAKSMKKTSSPAKGGDTESGDGPPDRKKLPLPEGGKRGPESPSSARPQSLS